MNALQWGRGSAVPGKAGFGRFDRGENTRRADPDKAGGSRGVNANAGLPRGPEAWEQESGRLPPRPRVYQPFPLPWLGASLPTALSEAFSTTNTQILQEPFHLFSNEAGSPARHRDSERRDLPKRPQVTFGYCCSWKSGIKLWLRNYNQYS